MTTPAKTSTAVRLGKAALLFIGALLLLFGLMVLAHGLLLPSIFFIAPGGVLCWFCWPRRLRMEAQTPSAAHSDAGRGG